MSGSWSIISADRGAARSSLMPQPDVLETKSGLPKMVLRLADK